MLCERAVGGGKPNRLGSLLAFLMVTSVVQARFEITNANLDMPKTLQLKNVGGEILDQRIDAYVSTLESSLTEQDFSSLSPTTVLTVAATDLPGTGPPQEVSLDTSFQVPEPTDVCGSYFLILTLTEGSETVPYFQYPISRTKTCDNEDVDLKWLFEKDGDADFYLTVSPNEKVEMEGFKVSIENGGNTDLSLRSALDAPEVLAFVSERFYPNYYNDYEKLFTFSNISLQTAVESAVAMDILYGYEYNTLDSTRLLGWSSLMMDVTTGKSKEWKTDEIKEVPLTDLQGPGTIPCETSVIILIIDPFNKTNDSNRSNNVAVAPIKVGCIAGMEYKETDTCMVAADPVSDGRDALLINKEDGFPFGHKYMERQGRSGFSEVDYEELKTRFGSYQRAKEYADRLTLLGRCTEDPEIAQKAIDNSLVMEKLKLVQALRASLSDISPPEGAAADHEKVMMFLELADTLVTKALQNNGPVRYILLKLVSKVVVKNIIRWLREMPAAGMISPMMQSMTINLPQLLYFLERSPSDMGGPGGMGGNFGGMGGPGGMGGNFGDMGSPGGMGGNFGGMGGPGGMGGDFGDMGGPGGMGENFGDMGGPGGININFGDMGGPGGMGGNNNDKRKFEACAGDPECMQKGYDEMPLHDEPILTRIHKSDTMRGGPIEPEAESMHKKVAALLNAGSSSYRFRRQTGEFDNEFGNEFDNEFGNEFDDNDFNDDFPRNPMGGGSNNKGNMNHMGPNMGHNMGPNMGHNMGPNMGANMGGMGHGGGMGGNKFSSHMNSMGMMGRGANKKMSPLKQMVTQIFMQLASGTPAEDMDGLSFLDVPTRQLIKNVFDIVTKRDCPQIYLPFAVAGYNVTGEPAMAFMEANGFPVSPAQITQDFVESFIDFLKTNVSVGVREIIQDNQTLVDKLDLALLYMDVVKSNAEGIVNAIQSVVQKVVMDPEEVFLLQNIPGPEPTAEMYCMRKAQKDIALMTPTMQKEKDDSFFQDPIKEFLAMTEKKNKKPAFWKMENDCIFRGERSAVTGTMFWEKVAVCSCNKNPMLNFPFGGGGGPGGYDNGFGWSPGVGNAFGNSGDPSSFGNGFSGGFGGPWGSGDGGPSGFSSGFGGFGGSHDFGNGGPSGFSSGFGGFGGPQDFGKGSDDFVKQWSSDNRFDSQDEPWDSSNEFDSQEESRDSSNEFGGQRQGSRSSSNGNGGPRGKQRDSGNEFDSQDEPWDSSNGFDNQEESRDSSNEFGGQRQGSQSSSKGNGRQRKPSGSDEESGERGKSLTFGQEGGGHGKSSDSNKESGGLGRRLFEAFNPFKRNKRSYHPDRNNQKNTNIVLKNSNVKDSEGLVTVEGQVVVKLNNFEHISICDDGDWGTLDATVVCKSLLWEHLKDGHILTSATATSVPPTSKTSPARISRIHCRGNEDNILKCRHVRDQKCKVKEIGGVKCVLK